jgi:hypothetical protein
MYCYVAAICVIIFQLRNIRSEHVANKNYNFKSLES